jgi:hypothetical protein
MSQDATNWRKKFVRQYVAPIAPGALDKNDPQAMFFSVDSHGKTMRSDRTRTDFSHHHLKMAVIFKPPLWCSVVSMNSS